MHAQLLNEGDARTFVLVFDIGDDPVAGLTRFAAEQGIAPGIVVGQLQKRGVLAYSQMNSLKDHYQWSE